MKQQNKSTIERTVLWYVFLASIWAILLNLVPERPGVLSFLNLYKGIGYVVFSGILIYFLLLAGNRKSKAGFPEQTPNSKAHTGGDGTASSAETSLLDPGVFDASAVDAMIERFARALEMRNHDREGHNERLISLTLQLARAFSLPEEELIHIRRGAVLHDIGKITLPDSILLKNGLLNEAERLAMQQHPLEAYRLLSGLPFLEKALDIPYYHHERWDGKGYPQGLAGEQIPLAARLFAIVEVWEAMTSDRPYRKALPKRAALIFIRSQKGMQFDPQVVDQFLQLEQIAALRLESIDPEWELSLPVVSHS